MQGTNPDNFIRNPKLIGYLGRHHIYRIIIGNADDTHHGCRIRLLPAFNIHGLSPDQPDIQGFVAILKTFRIRFNSRDRVFLMLQSFGKIEAHATQSQNQNLFLSLIIEHDYSQLSINCHEDSFYGIAIGSAAEVGHDRLHCLHFIVELTEIYVFHNPLSDFLFVGLAGQVSLKDFNKS